MNHIPKYNIFKEPEGYFDTFHDRIIHKKKIRGKQVMLNRMAAAAVLIIGIIFIFFTYQQPAISETAFQAQLDQEVELYINSGYWDAEDVLILSEDPDALLDVIIAEEWSGYSINEDQLENEIWY